PEGETAPSPWAPLLVHEPGYFHAERLGELLQHGQRRVLAPVLQAPQILAAHARLGGQRCLTQPPRFAPPPQPLRHTLSEGHCDLSVIACQGRSDSLLSQSPAGLPVVVAGR